MPISIDEFRFPKFIKYKNKLPFIEDRKAKFYATSEEFNKEDIHIRRYRSEEYPQYGYNPHLNQAGVKKVNINNSGFVLPKY